MTTAVPSPSTRYLTHAMLMPITHSCQVFMDPKFSLFSIPVINIVFTSSRDYSRLIGCCRVKLQHYYRCDKARNFLYTLVSHWVSYINTKMNNDKHKGIFCGDCVHPQDLSSFLNCSLCQGHIPFTI